MILSKEDEKLVQECLVNTMNNLSDSVYTNFVSDIEQVRYESYAYTPNLFPAAF